MERKILLPSSVNNQEKVMKLNPEIQGLRFLIERNLFDFSRYQEKPYFITGTNGIKRQTASEFGFEVFSLAEAKEHYPNNHEERTQKQIYEEHGENGGITPFRRSKDSPPVVLELATDKAREKLAIREAVFEEFLKILPRKIQEFKRRFFKAKNLSDEEILPILIANDPDLRSFFLILQKTQKFFTTDSAWAFFSPDSQTITPDFLGDKTDLVHKPRDNDELLELLNEKISQGSHLQSISGVVNVEFSYDHLTGLFVPKFKKRMIIVDYGEIDESLVEFVSNSICSQPDNAMGLSSADLMRESSIFGLSGRKVRVRIYDYTDNVDNTKEDTDFRVSKKTNENPKIEEFELTIDSSNYQIIIALSLGIIPS